MFNKKIKIEIKSVLGNVLFTHECINNTIAKTVEEAVKSSVNLSYADLRFADLRSVNLSYADLRFADLSFANLSSTDLSFANLSFANLRSANLSSTDLRFANLRSANLSSTDLSFANLSSTDLRFADLRFADLSFANLSFANLSSVKTDKRYIQIGCIGSSKRLTTYCFEDDIVLCGCFKGTLKEFEEKVKKTHKDNKQYYNEYMGAIKYIKSIAKDTLKK